MTTKEAIELIERLLIEHRQTHANWLDFYTRSPRSEKVFAVGAGSLRDQVDAIADYDEALEAVNALFDKDKEEMRFFEGQYSALKRLRKFVSDKYIAQVQKEEKESEKEDRYYSDLYKEAMAVLLPHDHRLFDEIVEGLSGEDWIEEGGSSTFRLLHKQCATIKIFRHTESPQVIKICFSAEPEEEVKESIIPRITFTEEGVKEYLDKAINFWRISEKAEALIYIDAYQSVRTSLFGGLLSVDESKTDEKKRAENTS